MLDVAAIAAWAGYMPPLSSTATPYARISTVLQSRAVMSPAYRPEPRDARAAAAALREALEQAVDRALVGVERVAVMCGGGVDSSGLLALVVRAARRAGKRAFAVALDFQGEGDDRFALRAVEAHLGCEVVRVPPEEAARWVDLARGGGVDAAPLTCPTAPLEIALMARARAEGAERVLTGIGGDELFDGEPRALARAAASGAIRRALVDARSMKGFDPVRWPALAWVIRPMLVERLPRALRLRRALARPRTVPAWSGPRLRSLLLEQADAITTRAYGPRSAEEHYLEHVTRPLRIEIAWVRHQTEVASGIERYDPYLDPALVLDVKRLAPHWLVAGARRRGLFRDALGGDLPANARERLDKASFEPALERGAAAAGGLARWRPFVRAEQLAELGIVDEHAFALEAERFLAHPAPHDWISIWPVLACEAFLRARAGEGRA